MEQTPIKFLLSNTKDELNDSLFDTPVDKFKRKSNDLKSEKNEMKKRKSGMGIKDIMRK